MARAFVNSMQVVDTNSADDMQVNMSIGYWGPDLGDLRVLERPVAVIIRFDDSLPTIRNKMAAAIVSDATSIGLLLIANDVVLTDLQKG